MTMVRKVPHTTLIFAKYVSYSSFWIDKIWGVGTTEKTYLGTEFEGDICHDGRHITRAALAMGYGDRNMAKPVPLSSQVRSREVSIDLHSLPPF